MLRRMYKVKVRLPFSDLISIHRSSQWKVVMADLRAPDVCASLADSGPRRFAALRTSVRPPPASGPRQRTDDVQLTTVDEAGLRREALFRRTKRFGGPRRGASRPTKRGIMANVVPPSVVQPLTLAHRRYVQVNMDSSLHSQALKGADWVYTGPIRVSIDER